MHRMFLAALALAAYFQWPYSNLPQGSSQSGSALPGTCTTGDVFYKTGLPARGFYDCTATNTWVQQAGLAAGTIVLVASGSCPSGFAEVSSLSGKTLVGTVAANGDVGTTGGSDNITPAGTIAWPAGVPTTASVSAGTPAGTNGASATSGNCAATNIAAGTGSTTACKATAPNLTVSAQTFTGSALAGHTHTMSWPAGVPALTGTQFDNRSAFMKVIFCSKS